MAASALPLKPWTLSHCADFYFECQVEMGASRGVRRMFLAACPRSKSLRYTHDEKGEGAISIPYSRVVSVDRGQQDSWLILKIAGATPATAALHSSHEHRLENERDRDALLRFLQGQVAQRAADCVDFGGLVPPMPLLQGSCKKKGKLTWSRRYLVLQPGRLLIWRDIAAFSSHHVQPLNCISLSYVEVHKAAGGNGCVLHVRKAERDYVLEFAAGERDKWATAIEASSVAYIQTALAAISNEAEPAPSASAKRAVSPGRTVAASVVVRGGADNSAAAARPAASPSVAVAASLPPPAAAVQARAANIAAAKAAAAAAAGSSSPASAPAPAVQQPETPAPAAPVVAAADVSPPPSVPEEAAEEEEVVPPPATRPPAASMSSTGSMMPPPPPEEDEGHEEAEAAAVLAAAVPTTRPPAMSMAPPPPPEEDEAPVPPPAADTVAPPPRKHTASPPSASTATPSPRDSLPSKSPSPSPSHSSAAPSPTSRGSSYASGVLPSSRGGRPSLIDCSAQPLGFFDASAQLDDSVPPPPQPLGEGEAYSDEDSEYSRSSRMGGSRLDSSPRPPEPADDMHAAPAAIVRLNILLETATTATASAASTVPLGAVFVSPDAMLEVVRGLIGEELDNVPADFCFLLDDVPVGKRQEARLVAAPMGPHLRIRAVQPSSVGATASASLAAAASAATPVPASERPPEPPAEDEDEVTDAFRPPEPTDDDMIRPAAAADVADSDSDDDEGEHGRPPEPPAEDEFEAPPQPPEPEDDRPPEPPAEELHTSSPPPASASPAVGGGAAAASSAPTGPLSLTFYFKSSVGASDSDPCGLVELDQAQHDPATTTLATLRALMDDELDELPDFVFLQGGSVPLSRKQEAKKCVAAVVTPAGAGEEGARVYIKRAAAKASEPVVAAAPVPAAPPMAPPMSPSGPAAPFAPPLSVSASSSSSSSGPARSPAASPSSSSSSSSGGPSNALLDAIRKGASLRKAPSIDANDQSGGGGRGGPGNLSRTPSASSKSPSGAPDLMSQLANALAGRRKDLQPVSDSKPAASVGGISLGSMRFGAPRAQPAPAVTEPPKEVVWD